ncbi:MAG: rod shape-determining protein RodA [Sphingobacteriales bacterium]|nr:MAG: rod shape-determining protein RodA [Sphingobacteriales bacterium]
MTNAGNNDFSSRSILANLDWLAASIYLALIVIGIVNIYSSEYSEGQQMIINFSMSHGHQLMWLGISIVLAFMAMLLDSRIYHTISYLVYGFGIALLLVTLVIGKTVAGAKGWIQIGGFQFQSAEVVKLATVMALAKYLSTHGVDIRNVKQRWIAFGIVLLPCALVLAQNDTGSAMVFFSLVFVLFRQGLSPWYIIMPVWLGILSLAVLIVGIYPVLITLGILTLLAYYFVRRQPKIILVVIGAAILSAGLVFSVDFGVNHVLQDYQRERIDVLIGKEVDPKGAGYNVHQSLIAIGSGGLYGKGFLGGTQTKYNFVPEQSTDFIFCTIGEEYGFAGSALLILLYLTLMYRIVKMAERQKFMYNRCYAYGVLSILFFHFTINLSMTMGLFPVVGIPLPFVSYGGSSLMAFTLLLFILLKLDAANREY